MLHTNLTNHASNFLDGVEERDARLNYVMVALYVIVGCVSFVSNSLIFLTVGMNRKLWTNSYCLLVSLAVTDWLIIVVGIPVHVANVLAGHSVMNNQLCKVYGFFINVPFQSSIYHLSVIAFHRYYLTVRRKSYEKVFGNKKIIITIGMAWLIPMVICMIPLFGWGKYFYDPTREHCMLDWTFSLSFTIFIEIMVFPSNVLIMVYCYFKIITKARRRLKADIDDRKKTKRRQLELRSTYMMLVVVMTCVTCFIPYCITMFYELFCQCRLPRVYGFVAMLLAYSNSMCDFVIYSAMNKRFRRCCRQVFLIFRRKFQRSNNNAIIPEEQVGDTVSPFSTSKGMRTVNVTKPIMTESITTGSSSMKTTSAELFFVRKTLKERTQKETQNE